MISIKQGGKTTKCLLLQFSQRIVFICCRLVGMVWKQEPEATWMANICSLSLWSTEALVWGRSWTMLPFCSSVTHESDWDYSSMTSTSITCLLQVLFRIIITNKRLSWEKKNRQCQNWTLLKAQLQENKSNGFGGDNRISSNVQPMIIHVSLHKLYSIYHQHLMLTKI